LNGNGRLDFARDSRPFLPIMAYQENEISRLLYRLNDLLMVGNHECDATLTRIRDGVYTLILKCRNCLITRHFENESFDRLCTRTAAVKSCRKNSETLDDQA
jgi:hypothetical protein